VALELEDLFVKVSYLGARLGGDDDLHPDEEIAGFASPADAFAGNLQGGVVLDPGGYDEFDLFSVDRLHLDSGSNDRLGRAHFDIRLEIVSRALETWMGPYLDLDEEIPVGGSIISSLPEALHPESHPRLDAGRYVNSHLAVDLRMARTLADCAFLFWDPTPPPALGASAHPHELAEYRLAHLPHLPGTAAPWAVDKLLRLAPGSIALEAGLDMFYFDLLLRPEDRLIERDPQLHQDVRTRPRASMLPPPACKPAAKEGLKDIPEPGEVSAEPAGISTTGV